MVTKVIRESEVEKYLVDMVFKMGGFTRKLQWIGRRGAPDRLVILFGRVYFIELKRPGKVPNIVQQRELDRMQAHGAITLCISSKDAVDLWVSHTGYKVT